MRKLVDVIHQQHRVEASGFGLLGLRDHGCVELGNRCAVGKIGDLQAEPQNNATTVSGRRLRGVSS